MLNILLQTKYKAKQRKSTPLNKIPEFHFSKSEDGKDGTKRVDCTLDMIHIILSTKKNTKTP